MTSGGMHIPTAWWVSKSLKYTSTEAVRNLLIRAATDDYCINSLVRLFFNYEINTKNN